MYSIIRGSCLFSLCAALCGCVATEEIIKADTAMIDLVAVEKLGKKIEKYDFVPHRAVIETKGDVVVRNSFDRSCERAKGEGVVTSRAYFAEAFQLNRVLYKKLYEHEYTAYGLKCMLPGKETIEITLIRSGNLQDGNKYFAVIQDKNDIEVTRKFIDRIQAEKALEKRKRDEEVQQILQSAIDDWQHASNVLRSNLKPGSTAYFVVDFSNLRHLWFEVTGLVVEVKPPLAFIQFQNDHQWVKIETINAKVPKILFCGNNSEITKNGSWTYRDRQYKGRCFQAQ